MNSITNKFSDMNLSSEEHNNTNTDLHNITDSMKTMGIGETMDINENNDTFGKIKWWSYGIPNNQCKLIDDEDFAYCHFTLPNTIFAELTDSGMNSYVQYFDTFCCNNEEIFLSLSTVVKTAELFDNIFSKRLINFNDVYEVVSSANQELRELLKEESYIHNYFTDYTHDLIKGLTIIMDMLMYYSTYFESENYHNMISILNNYCVIVIYLKFYFESNILSPNDEIIIR